MSTALAADVRTRSVAVRIEPVKRSADGAMRIKGTAVVYNVPSPAGNLPFREVIKAGAFRDTLAHPETDLLLLVGHDRNRPLARQSAGNLTVRDTPRGLEFEAELVDTSDGRDAFELLRSRVVKGCSFAFRPDPLAERWYERDGETWVEVGRADLYELTLTADPVYTSTDASARSAALAAIRRRQLTVRQRSPYGPESGHSFFRDLETLTAAQRATRRYEDSGGRRHPAAPLLESGFPDRVHGGLEQARARLTTVNPVYRDLGTSALVGQVDTENGVPEFIQAALGDAARAHRVLADQLERHELPRGFIVPISTVKASQVTTPAVADVQATENTAPTSTDIAATDVELKPATIAGKFTLSRQLVDRAQGVDLLIARELGGAVGAKLESQLLNGSGASGQMLGILNALNIIAVAYTDATPTQAELWAPLLQARSKVATQSGEVPTIVALHPRRGSWLLGALDSQNAWARLNPPLTMAETIGMPATLGAGTNEDAIIVIAPSGLVLFERPNAIIVDDESGGPQKITFSAWHYAALVIRQPKAIAAITGTGLIAPTGY